MFHEKFDHDNRNIDEIITAENAGAIIKSWKQSREVQEDIAARVYTISQDEAASALASFFSQRYEEAPTDEKLIIIKACENLGIHNLPAHEVTTEFLVNLQSESSPEVKQIVEALKGKVMNATNSIDYLTKKNQPISEAYPKIIGTACDKLMAITLENDDKEIKISAMSGLWRGTYAQKHSEISQFLKEYIGGQDNDISTIALAELFSVIDPHDPYLTMALRAEISTHDFPTMDRSEILKFVFMAERNQDPSFRDFLDQLSEIERFQDDFEFNKYLDSAKKSLK